jgi:hypothetical protein
MEFGSVNQNGMRMAEHHTWESTHNKYTGSAQKIRNGRMATQMRPTEINYASMGLKVSKC